MTVYCTFHSIENSFLFLKSLIASDLLLSIWVLGFLIVLCPYDKMAVSLITGLLNPSHDCFCFICWAFALALFSSTSPFISSLAVWKTAFRCHLKDSWKQFRRHLKCQKLQTQYIGFTKGVLTSTMLIHPHSLLKRVIRTPQVRETSKQHQKKVAEIYLSCWKFPFRFYLLRDNRHPICLCPQIPNSKVLKAASWLVVRSGIIATEWLLVPIEVYPLLAKTASQKDTMKWIGSQFALIHPSMYTCASSPGITSFILWGCSWLSSCGIASF